ncbi:hypothetical protein ACFVT9_36020 [Kitasatospora cineracea]|uniref:hypothetical protein n=1 Tax=Kitasatospora cineracea TaxID=88074 RepID=UPI0036D92665
MDPVEAPPGSRRVEAVLIDSDHVLAHTTTGGPAAGSAFHLYRFDNPYKPTAILTVAGAPVPTSAAPAGPPTPPAPRQR